MPACTSTTAHAFITGDALKPHVQDALDEIEYVTGSTSTTGAHDAPRTDIRSRSSFATWKSAMKTG